MTPPGTPTSKRVQVAQRRERAVDLRVSGKSWAQIATALNYSSPGAACQDVSRALDDALLHQRQSVDRLRQVSSARLESLLAAVWPQAQAGSLRAVDVAVRVIERLSRLYGTDADTRVAVLSIDALDEEIARLTVEVAAVTAQVEASPPMDPVGASWDDWPPDHR